MEIQKDSLLPQFATVCELSDKDRFRNYSEEQEMNQRVHLRSRLGARKFSRCNQSFRYFSNLRRKIILNLIQQCEESAKERIKTGSEPRAHPFFSPKKSKDVSAHLVSIQRRFMWWLHDSFIPSFPPRSSILWRSNFLLNPLWISYLLTGEGVLWDGETGLIESI